ncbi:MAG: baseplate J/gp47 family protein [Leptospirales bacterium]
MFTPKKYTEILNDLKDRTEILSDFEPGSVARTLYESFSFEIAALYEKMNFVYLSAYIDTASGVQLENVVSILGIKRGLPDFAEGYLTLTKDEDKDDIELTPGTMVSTEETPESPRKMFRIIEQKIFSKGQSEISIKIQALLPGAEQIADPETIIVMPRPISGIKTIWNPKAIIFSGKKLETDEQLRERAKNCILAAGKATSFSIENAVLALGGVRDVKVKENFIEDAANPGQTQGTGIIEVFVDSADLSHEDPEVVARERDRIFEAINPVKAAGIYVKLSSAVKVLLHITFSLEIRHELKLNQVEMTAIEKQVSDAITGYIGELKMGDTFLSSQVTKRILSIDEISDFEIIKIVSEKVGIKTTLPASTRRIEAEALEKFAPGDMGSLV